MGPEGKSVGLSQYYCALRQYTNAHEMGHILGAMHNDANSAQLNVTDNSGYYMQPPVNSGKRTLIA